MPNYAVRRLVLAVPTLLLMNLMAPGDPLSDVPLTIPTKGSEKMRVALLCVARVFLHQSFGSA